MGLSLSTDEEKKPDLVKQKIYIAVLFPILQSAVAAGDLQEVLPNANSVLERAHMLPAKEGAIKPVTGCFYTHDTRALVFRHKKTSAPKHVAGMFIDLLCRCCLFGTESECLEYIQDQNTEQ
jgi:hypothetical protein